ncbi:MAG: UDP-glucose 4-epimerase GalE, partial [Pseudonocardiaceae bacterium]
VDLADAHELALEQAVPGEHRIYNLGNGTGFSVQQVVDTCRQVTGHPIPVQPAARRPGDPAVLIAASDRARDELGWKPERAELAAIVADAWNFATWNSTRAIG